MNTTTVGNDNKTVIQNTVNGYDTDITATIESNKASMVMVLQGSQKNSGVIFGQNKEDVYIMTSSTGLQNQMNVSVQFDNGVIVGGIVSGIDEDTSLALVTVSPGFEVSIIKQGDSSVLSAGEYVIGLGARRATESCEVGYGIISSPSQMRIKADGTWVTNVLETDILVNVDNIGGALLNLDGELLGIIISDPAYGLENVGYAIAINEVTNVYQELKDNGAVTHGSLGIVARSISKMRAYEKSAQSINLDQVEGVFVTDILSYAKEDETIQVGDQIISFNNKKVANVDELQKSLYGFVPGDVVPIVVRRAGEEISGSVVLK